MHRSPTDPRLLLGALLVFALAAPGAAEPSRSGSSAHRAPAPAARQSAAADDEDDTPEAATARAVAGGVGTTSRWTSETRANVRGSPTAVARRGECMTVTDIVIIDGEETRAPKRMCRRPPANRYVRV